ncbi:MAG: hypothetical protein PUB45_05655 [Bacteroidales bacterium]|nr:hypothetical protein [Bacteroidales bacterium]
MVRIFARISLLVFAALVPAAASLYAQTPAEKMKAKVDSLREAALKPQPRQEERRDSIKLQSIDPKMDAAIDSLLSIPVDSSIFKGEYISLSAIEIEDLCQKGRLYAEEYDFDEAFNCFEKAFSLSRDSLQKLTIREMMLEQENAVNLRKYCSKPTVVARQVFPLKDFFLYYPLQDHAWRPAPNVLDPDGGEFSRAIYAPERSKEIIFSAQDSLGRRGIMRTAWADTAWTSPSLLLEGMIPPENEIYPMLCGNKLYFASKGLYGIGGYDIYVSVWDEEAEGWSVPENLGFPYNSPYDDFLFINSDDGKYSIFASNRECPPDSVCLYVLEYEPVPVRSSVDDASELYRLCSLVPSYDLKKVDNSAAMSQGNGDEQTRAYIEKMSELRALKDTLSIHHKELEELRARYNSATDWQRVNLADEIVSKEAQLPAIQKRIDTTGKELQQIEMEFLMNGVVIDAGKAVAESDKTIVGVDKSYTFTRKNPGYPL